MMRREPLLFLVVFGLFQMFLADQVVIGFDDKAHINLSDRAARMSALDTFLKASLGFEFPAGIEEPTFNGQNARELIQQGAVDEDRPILWRPRHHFHNPRLAWAQAGWRPPPFSIQLGESSVIWSQDENQIVGGKHSWKDARDSYFQALTATSDSERKQLYAETFKSLGHLIHLVQDAATPSHTRNDTHLNFKGIGDPEVFHGWAEGTDARDMIASSAPPAFDISLLNQPSPDAQAAVPISRLIDSTAGDIGLLALTPGLNLGIAEYASANFFSDSTVNSTAFLSPRSSQIEVRDPEPDATGTRLRRYVYFRSGFGEQDYPLAAASALAPFVIDPLATPTDQALDTKVLRTYGAKLFPRAIGYSAGLIDYFIRGRLELENIQTISATSMQVKVKNATAAEETGSGEMKAVLAFTREGQQSFAVSSSRGVNLTRQAQDIAFDFSQNPIPFDAVNRSFFVVYKGLLGLEEGAVFVGKCGMAETSGFITVDFPGAVRGTEIRRINACGQVVGTAYFSLSVGESKGFIADSNGIIQQTVEYNGPLEPQGEYYSTEGNDIDNQGRVFGWYCCGTIGDRSFRREPGGSSADISPSGSQTSHIYGANDAGDVVGEYHPNPEGGVGGYVLYANGSFRDLGDRAPMDINNVGQIVGISGYVFCPCHGFLRNPDGSFISIDYPGATSTYVYGINDSGQIVGYYTDGAFNRHGFIGRIPSIE